MSYVEKIISDIIQTTSDLFSNLASICETGLYVGMLILWQNAVNQMLAERFAFAGAVVLFHALAYFCFVGCMGGLGAFTRELHGC